MATPRKHIALANFAQAAVYTLIVIAILGVLNFLAQRYNKSLDATANKKYTLSDQTAKVVKKSQGRTSRSRIGIDPAASPTRRICSIAIRDFRRKSPCSIKTSTRTAPKRSLPA